MTAFPPAESPLIMMFSGETFSVFTRYRYEVRQSWIAAGNAFDVLEAGSVERRYCGARTWVAGVCLSNVMAQKPVAS